MSLEDNRRTHPQEIPGLKPWDIQILTPLEVSQMDHLQRMRHFAEWGILAPTSHNTSPEKFKITPEGLIVLLDRKFVLQASDQEGRQATISIGCVVENIVQAAQAYGLLPEIEIIESDIDKTLPLEPEEQDLTDTDQSSQSKVFSQEIGVAKNDINRTIPRKPKEKNLAPLVTMTFKGNVGKEVDKETLEAIKARKVLRATYDSRTKLPKDLAQQMTNLVKSLPDLKLHIKNSFDVVKLLARFQRSADNAAIGIEGFRNELREWFLPNQDGAWALRGMLGRDFGMTDDASTNFAEGLRGKRNLLPDELSGFAKSGEDGILSSSALCFITGKGDTIGTRINAGRAFTRTSLILEKNGFSTAVHAALTEKEIDSAVKLANGAARARLLTTDEILMVFRVGIPKHEEDKNRTHSVRPPIEELIL